MNYAESINLLSLIVNRAPLPFRTWHIPPCPVWTASCHLTLLQLFAGHFEESGEFRVGFLFASE